MELGSPGNQLGAGPDSQGNYQLGVELGILGNQLGAGVDPGIQGNHKRAEAGTPWGEGKLGFAGEGRGSRAAVRGGWGEAGEAVREGLVQERLLEHSQSGVPAARGRSTEKNDRREKRLSCQASSTTFTHNSLAYVQ